MTSRDTSAGMRQNEPEFCVLLLYDYDSKQLRYRRRLTDGEPHRSIHRERLKDRTGEKAQVEKLNHIGTEPHSLFQDVWTAGK